MKKIKSFFMTLFKGFCMGTADIIPGVSGGTIAFLFGIYERLIAAIHAVDMELFKLCCRGRFGQACRRIDWALLVPLFTGILAAIFSLSHLLKWLLANHEVYVFAFFFGLIAMTVIIIAQEVRRFDFAKLSVGLLSAVLMYKVVGMVPLETPDAWWFLFLSGAVAIMAMILPGISGAFILLILGKYEFIITAVTEHRFDVLLLVGLGCVVGLLSFVRFLNWLLTRHRDVTLSFLAGLVLGSLRKVWPWKETLETGISSGGKIISIQHNVLPDAFTLEIAAVAGLCILGLIISYGLSQFDRTPDSR